MLISEYKPTNLNRVNPEFVGIAQKYSLHKKNRLEVQQRRNSLLTNLKFKMSIDSSLQKSLQNKKSELNRVKQIRDRRDDNHQEKMNDHQRKQKALEDLKRKSNKARRETKLGIQEAQSKLISKNKKGKEDISTMFMTMRSQFTSRRSNELDSNKIRFRTIKTGEKNCHDTVDGYHRSRNLMSLNNYKQMIEEEASKVNKYTQEISSLETSIENYDRKIDTKKRNLYEVLDEISLYTLEPKDTQIKCLPYFLRENRLLSSQHSSRPSQILLKGARNLIKNEESLQVSGTK